jgi:hypothetical protein
MLGGASNPVAGSNPVGTGKTLQYIGNKAYAYSGVIDLDNSDVVMLQFETGNSNFIGFLAIQNGSGSGDDMRYILSLNGEVVLQVYGGTSDVFNQFQFPIDLVIPAYTKVELTGRNINSSTLRAHTAILTGEVF